MHSLSVLQLTRVRLSTILVSSGAASGVFFLGLEFGPGLFAFPFGDCVSFWASWKVSLWLPVFCFGCCLSAFWLRWGFSFLSLCLVESVSGLARGQLVMVSALLTMLCLAAHVLYDVRWRDSAPGMCCGFRFFFRFLCCSFLRSLGDFFFGVCGLP